MQCLAVALSASPFRTSLCWPAAPDHRRQIARFTPQQGKRSRRRAAKGAGVCRCSSSGVGLPWSLLPWNRRADRHHPHHHAMGQFSSKEQKHSSVRKIIDKVFKNFAGDDDGKVTFHELYPATLLVYNDINKYIPGPHHDPPSREDVRKLMEEFDTNSNGVLDREEFAAFLQKFTKNIYTGVSKSLIVYSIAPLMAFVAKRATEELPRVGPVVRRIPNFVYATIVTTAVAIIGHRKAIDD